jgi:mannitol-1-phosphate 5-dehydrogenase
MGHALTAYLGYIKGLNFIWEAIGDKEISYICMNAMQGAAAALSAEHGVPEEKIKEHVSDLISRFGNRFLGDTIERVGKDPVRKLSPKDRFIGAMNLCRKHDINSIYICIGVAAALCFDNENDQAALQIQRKIAVEGLEAVAADICGLSDGSQLYENIVKFYKMLRRDKDLKAVIEMAEQVNI